MHELPKPYFSIIIPCWNRADTIRRCMDSCLRQDFADFEVMVVDDGSEDDTLSIIKEYAGRDRRVRPVALERNQGVSVARNAGARAATADWLFYLDSDDALTPGALKKSHEICRQVPSDVGVVAFAYDTDYGRPSPFPLPPDGIWLFESYLKWVDGAASTDYLKIHRRECWQKFHWPNDRGLQTLTTLRILSQWKFCFSSRVVGTVYTNAPNRYTSSLFRSQEFILRTSRDSLAEQETVVKEFGDELRKHAPHYYEIQLRAAAVLSFLSGQRVKGSRYTFKYLRRRPWSLRGWVIFVSGLAGPAAMMRIRKRFA